MKQQGHTNISRQNRAVGLHKLLQNNKSPHNFRKKFMMHQAKLTAVLDDFQHLNQDLRLCHLQTKIIRESETNNRVKCCCWFTVSSMFLENIHHQIADATLPKKGGWHQCWYRSFWRQIGWDMNHRDGENKLENQRKRIRLYCNYTIYGD